MLRFASVAAVALALTAGNVCQAVVVPSVYNNSIYAYYPPGGDPSTDPNVGTAFDDWADVPVAITDPEDNPGSVDFKAVKIANDENYVYLYIEYFGEPSLSTYVSFDTDMNTATGFNIYGLNLVGSDASYLNDFPFSQLNGGFNEGALYGGPFGNGGAPIFPFWNLDGNQREWMFPLNVTHDSAGTKPVFTQDTFNILIWNQEGQGDIIGTAPNFDVITYTLAVAPTVEGDYTGDGLVDAADYTVWRDSENDLGPDLPADGNGDGEVNQADYTIWANNYGAPGSPSSVGVPEPSTLLMAAFAFGVLLRRPCC